MLGTLTSPKRRSDRLPSAAVDALADVPLEPARPRYGRQRRGGPRTPLPLMGLIAICTGIGLAYVAQVAHVTQATYQTSQLQSDGMQLRTQVSQLDDQLARLKATERIVSAAQQLGMRPAAQWTFVTAPRTAVIPPNTQTTLAAPANTGALQRLAGFIGDIIGVAAGPNGS